MEAPFLRIGKRVSFCLSTREKVVAVTARTIVVSLCCLAAGKLFAHVLLVRVKDKLIATRRKEKRGFTPGRSTIDRITTLNLILQSRREHQRLLWINYVDLKAAIDSVDRSALWLLLRSLGLPQCLKRLWL